MDSEARLSADLDSAFGQESAGEQSSEPHAQSKLEEARLTIGDDGLVSGDQWACKLPVCELGVLDGTCLGLLNAELEEGTTTFELPLPMVPQPPDEAMYRVMGSGACCSVLGQCFDHGYYDGSGRARPEGLDDHRHSA